MAAPLSSLCLMGVELWNLIEAELAFNDTDSCGLAAAVALLGLIGDVSMEAAPTLAAATL